MPDAATPDAATPIQAAIEANATALREGLDRTEAARGALAAFDKGGAIPDAPLAGRVEALVVAMVAHAEAAGLRREAVLATRQPTALKIQKLAMGLDGLCRENGLDFNVLAEAAMAGEEKDYAINVRAIVFATVHDAEAFDGVIEDWEIYDTSEGNEPNAVKVRCDQLVRVRARTDAEAIGKAKDAASPITMKGCEIDDVELWVDAGIDINPEHAEPESPGMAPGR